MKRMCRHAGPSIVHLSGPIFSRLNFSFSSSDSKRVQMDLSGIANATPLPLGGKDSTIRLRFWLGRFPLMPFVVDLRA